MHPIENHKEKPERPRISEKVKQRLYPAVLALFAEHDFHRVNIREISKRTGVSTGTLYKYFRSKEELIFAILDEHITRIGLLISEHIKGMADIKEIFRKVFWVTLDFYDQHPGVAITAFITVPTRTWMQDASYRRRDDLSLLKHYIEQARVRGEIDPHISFQHLVDAYYMICYRMIHNWYYAGMTGTLTEKLDEYYYLFWKMIMPVHDFACTTPCGAAAEQLSAGENGYAEEC
jgi:AcrR family transcriptional regulator